MNGSIHTLCVDDEPGFAEMAATFLERENDHISTSVATSASEALERIEADSPDCIVSDYNMPDKNGLELLEDVREIDDRLPFILYTGKGSEAIASEAISAGVTDYLQKKGGDSSQYAVLANRVSNAVEQYRARTEVERSQQRLSLFIDQSPLGVLEYDSDFEIVRVNQRGQEILGYDEAELLGETWEKLVTEDSYENVDQVTDQLTEASGGFHSIDENVRGDGEYITVEWFNRVITDDDGDMIAVLSLFRDVTEEREREQQREEALSRLEVLHDRSPDMVNFHDEDGNIIDPNSQLCAQTGYDATELTCMKVWDIDEALSSERAKEMWTALEKGDRKQIRGRYRRKDGSTFPVEVHLRKVTISSEERFVVIGRDISERVEYEERLQRQNERLEEFTSVISHDLRNPLNVADGQLQLAQETAAGNSPHIESAREAIARSQRLVTDLLELARQGDDISETEPVELHRIAETCWQALETGGNTLAVEVERTVVADPGRLRQLFQNLFENAVRHNDADVTVTVGPLDDGFYIADDGVGLPLKVGERLFEPGYSEEPDGTGFGLNIVERIVEAHGWDITTTASVEGGAQFNIRGVEFV
jgi:PAS domain S-box-containing protein